jgi:DNA invertase Pin-like site-specific DNA recombinase
MRKAYAYIRVSTVDQAESGFSLDAQKESARAYYDMLIRQDRYADLKWGGFYSDKGQSAWKLAFHLRKEGARITGRLKDGDQIIFCKLDRAFRSLKDAINQMEDWMQSDIGVHFVDQGLNMDTANGRLVVNVMTCVAQWESEIKSERVRSALMMKKKNHQPVNQKVPAGKKTAGNGRNKRYVMDTSQRPVLRLIKYLRNRGMSYRRISDRIELLQASRAGRKPIPETHFKLSRDWGWRKVCGACENMDYLMPDGCPSERRKIWNRSEL